MTVRKKLDKVKAIGHLTLDEIINLGGKTLEDSRMEMDSEEEIRFTLRLSRGLINKLDKDRKSRVGNVSRNQWIVELISEKVKDK